MLFSRIISYFAFTAALGSLTVAKPVGEQSDLGAVQNIVMNLKSSTDAIIPELKNMIANNNVTEVAAVPLMNQLISAVNNARNSVVLIPLSAQNSLSKRQDASDIANLLAEIITDIATIVDGLDATGILSILTSELGVALTVLVSSLAGVITGLVVALSGLLSTVSGLLSSIGLGLLLGILGL